MRGRRGRVRQVEDQLRTGQTSTEAIPSPCPVEKPVEPCSIVILGASGDLTARKLIPALFRLYVNNGLPDSFLIVGCSRTRWSAQEFRAKMGAAVGELAVEHVSHWGSFEQRLTYYPVDYDSTAAFDGLARSLQEPDQAHETAGNRIFYLAIPPTLYKTVAERLGQAGLSQEGVHGNGWSRLVVEKPFGRDLGSARDLDRSLHRYFQEEQIYRIDHYLAKETVQNVLMFRFANAIFEPIWNRRYIDSVSIMAAETLGVEHRAGYYEDAGVLRDMFQNHMMQLLALSAMEPLSRFEAERVRDEKAKVFGSLRPLPLDRLPEHVVLGQYGPGVTEGERVPGYREEECVDSNSLTPTFASMRVFIDNWRWQGVPFILTSGKRLARKATSIVIRFREVPHSMFLEVLGEKIAANELAFEIYPEEEIALTIQAKSPGAKVCLRSVKMRFDYQEDAQGPTLDAYEKVLLDCIHGDRTLFWRQDGVELCWSFLTPVLEECETCWDRAQRLHFYEAGSWGPEASRDWIKGISARGF